MGTPYRHQGRRHVDDWPGCRVCLDFGHLNDLGPCPWCDPDAYAEHVLMAAESAHLRAIAEDEEVA